MPSAAQQAAYANGDSRRYYYGIGTSVDFDKARAAAFAELARGEGLVIGDRAVLMMLYANGYGVRRDLELAIKLACDGEGAPAELEGRVLHLDRMRNGAGGVFDVCDDVTSGFMTGHCAALAEERTRGQREGAVAQWTASWPKEQAAALKRLKAAADAFYSAHVAGELDLSGTDRSAVMIEEQSTLEQRFLEAIRDFESGELPPFDAAAFATSEEQLNRVYKEVLAKDFSGTTITPAGIRAAERKWIAYRDAWVSLGRLRYPHVDPGAWKTWLNVGRVEQLTAL